MQNRAPSVQTFMTIEHLESRRLLAAAFALTTANELLGFDTSSPGTITSNRRITNLQPGEIVHAIDFRPATGQLYGLGSTSRLYLINPRTGAATQVGDVFAVPLVGDSFDLDFNPTVDRIRVVSNREQNFRLNPITGAVVDGDPGTSGIQGDEDLEFDAGDPNAGTDPLIAGAAYTNNVPGATSTTLFTIDSERNLLLTQGSPGGTPTSPNSGALFTVGPLGLDVIRRLGFDISTVNGADTGYAVFQVTGQVRPAVYSVNLETGASAPIGRLGSTRRLTDIAIAPKSIQVIALSTANELIRFDAAIPGTVVSRRTISGVLDGESIVGIDFRPATEELYGVGSSSQLYKLNPATGAATPVGGPFAVRLRGTAFGLDFNPAADRIRLVSNANQNLRINPDTGAVVDFDTTTVGVQPDPDLQFDAGDPNASADPLIAGAGYSRNFPGTTSTTLFGIDTTLNALVTQGSPGGAPTSPNTGQLFTVGALGVDVTSRLGLDIVSDGGIERAIGLFQLEGTSTPTLFSINLGTGAATRIGDLGGNRRFSDVAIVPA